MYNVKHKRMQIQTWDKIKSNGGKRAFGPLGLSGCVVSVMVRPHLNAPHTQRIKYSSVDSTFLKKKFNFLPFVVQHLGVTFGKNLYSKMLYIVE